MTIEETNTISGVFDPSPQISTDASPIKIGMSLCNVPKMRFPAAVILVFTNMPGGGCVDREKKSLSVSFRVSPGFQQAPRIAALSVRRTQTNSLETIVVDAAPPRIRLRRK